MIQLKSELITVLVPMDANLSQIPFKLNNNIKGKLIMAIEAYTDDTLSFPPKPDNPAAVTVGKFLFKNATLILNVNGREDVQIPMVNLKRSRAEGVGGDVWVAGITQFNGVKADWEKSRIQLNKPIDTSVLAAQAFVLLVHYQ